MLVCNTTNKRLAAVSGFYFAQGIPDGFVYTTLAAVLAERGVGLEAIGHILAMATLPWTIKFLWGMVIDRFPLGSDGSRRPWILVGQSGVTAMCVVWLWVDDITRVTSVLAWMVFVQNVFGAIQDTAVDAMAVEMLPDKEKGRANGFMKASNIAGLIVGGVCMSWLITRFSLRAALIVQVILLTIAVLFTWLVIEPPEVRSQRVNRRPRSWEDLFRTFLAAFKAFTPILAAVIGVVTALASGLFGTGTSVFFIQKLGWTRDSLVALSGGWSYAVGLLAALAGGYLSDRIGHRKVAVGAAICTTCVIIFFPLLQSCWSVAWLMGTLLIMQSITSSVLGVSLFAVYMDISWKEIAATQFCAYMAMLNLGGTLGEKFVGPLVSQLGWAATFGAIAGVYALTALLLAFVSIPKKTESTS